MEYPHTVLFPSPLLLKNTVNMPHKPREIHYASRREVADSKFIIKPESEGRCRNCENPNTAAELKQLLEKISTQQQMLQAAMMNTYSLHMDLFLLLRNRCSPSHREASCSAVPKMEKKQEDYLKAYKAMSDSAMEKIKEMSTKLDHYNERILVHGTSQEVSDPHSLGHSASSIATPIGHPIGEVQRLRSDYSTPRPSGVWDFRSPSQENVLAERSTPETPRWYIPTPGGKYHTNFNLSPVSQATTLNPADTSVYIHTGPEHQPFNAPTPMGFPSDEPTLPRPPSSAPSLPPVGTSPYYIGSRTTSELYHYELYSELGSVTPPASVVDGNGSPREDSQQPEEDSMEE